MASLNIAARITACSLAAALPSAAVAQPDPIAAAVTPAPPAWTIEPDNARGIVQISSTAKDGAARFVGGCTRVGDPGLRGIFSRYRGAGLRTDGEIERVLFYVRGDGWQEAFSAQIRYAASSGAWEVVKPLAPVFVNSFSRGATLAVVNGRREEVFAFDLTGSTAAARAMRGGCGFP